jgi:hypothetical protein
VSVTDIHLRIMEDAEDEYSQLLSELFARNDARDHDGISAMCPRFTQNWVKIKRARQALGSAPVLGLPPERHGGDGITHN